VIALLQPYLMWIRIGVLVVSHAFAAWAGYWIADKSAEVTALQVERAALRAAQATLTAERDEYARRARAAREVTESANARSRDAEAQKDELLDEIEDFKRRLASVPDDGCRWTPGDLEWLRAVPRAAPGPSPTPVPAGPPGGAGGVQ
jgi:hypothetical protein